MSSRYLINYAIHNSWCDPKRDSQYHIKASRVTPGGYSSWNYGATNYVSVLNKSVPLPKVGIKYHVFSVGAMPAEMLGLLNRGLDTNQSTVDYSYWVRDTWLNFGTTMISNKVMVDIYAPSGERIPVSTSYFMFTSDGAVLFCIEEDTNLAINYSSEDIFLRVYSNYYFKNGLAVGVDDIIYTKGYNNITNDQIFELQTLYNAYAARAGGVLCWVNGYIVPALSVVTIQVGDTAEFVFDGSIESIVTYNLNSLATFDSFRDNESKYLLNNQDNQITEIKFVDDCDIYVEANVLVIQNNVTFTRRYGYYLDSHRVSNKRQVTHHDYSLSYLSVQAVADNLKADLEEDHPSAYGAPQVLNKANFFIKKIYRKDGINQPLVDNASRIQDLYKLSAQDRILAMVGVTATLEVWRAYSLENSPFIRHLDAHYGDLNNALLREAYGYNAISKIVGDTPTQAVLQSTQMVAPLAPQLWSQSTAYEYDIDGLLVGSYLHTGGDTYVCNPANTNITKTVEVLSGVATTEPNIKFGTNGLTITPGWNYRVYVCPKIANLPNDEWVDITRTNDYNIVNSVVVYTGPVVNPYLAVKSDDTFLQLEFDLNMQSGSFTFDLAQLENRGFGSYTKTATLPFGLMDLFINGRSAVIGIDYFFDFPTITIVNHKYLVQPADTTSQRILVRCYGFCNEDMTMNTSSDNGFIKHGYLSDNTRFDVRDDRVLHISVDGKLKRRDQIEFSEEHSGVRINHVDNGLPYQIKEIRIPMIGYTDTDTYAMRQQAMTIDNAVSDFLSAYIEPYDRGGLMSIPQKHTVYSPFFASIIHDMKIDNISEATCLSLTGTQSILDYMQPYMSLYNVDPLKPSNEVNTAFVDVRAHTLDTTVSLGPEQFRVLAVLSSLYSHGSINMSNYITITT